MVSRPSRKGARESSGFDSSFQVSTIRSSCMTTKSVKVPPMSMPTR